MEINKKIHIEKRDYEVVQKQSIGRKGQLLTNCKIKKKLKKLE